MAKAKEAPMSTSVETQSQVRSTVEEMDFTDHRDFAEPRITASKRLAGANRISPWDLCVRGLPALAFLLVALLMVEIKDFSPTLGFTFLGLLAVFFIVTVWAWLPRS